MRYSDPYISLNKDYILHLYFQFQDKRLRQDERKKIAKALGDKAPPKLVPKTIDNMREPDETTVAPPTEVDEKVDEVLQYFFWKSL